MSFLQWLIADTTDAMSDAVLALSAGGLAWTVTHGLRALL